MAGVLPIAVYKNKLYFLFGRENKYNDTPGWSDFGGGIEPGETIHETNLREIEEETCGFISREDILRAMQNGTLVFKMRGYTTTIVLIPYDEKLPIYFNRNHQIIQKHLPNVIKKSVIFEKDQLQWFSWEDLDPILFRSFYQRMIQILFNNYDKIQTFAGF